MKKLYFFVFVIFLTFCSQQSRNLNKNLCDVHTSSCEFQIRTSKSIIEGNLDLTPKPVYAMKIVHFSLSLWKNKKVFEGAKVMLDLTMPAMYMGENQVSLQEIKPGIYSGKGVFPRCMSRDRLWNIQIKVKKNNQNFENNIQFLIRQ